MKDLEYEIQKTVEWIREVVTSAGCKGAVVGLSGGIDSSVVCHLLKRAFPDDSLGVILPCKSHAKDKEDAILAACAAGIRYVEVDLTSVHETLFDHVNETLPTEDKKNLRLADANLRARLRMSTIYTYANQLNYLVSGTDNAAEIVTGYFTKYGDGGVDFLPLANLTKREVFLWGEYLGVPESILKRPPSAGLWDGQTDESEMGTTYQNIDDYIEGKEIPSKDREIIEKLNKRSAHKRCMPPAPPIF